MVVATADGGIGVPASTSAMIIEHLGPIGGAGEAPHDEHGRGQHEAETGGEQRDPDARAWSGGSVDARAVAARKGREIGHRPMPPAGVTLRMRSSPTDNVNGSEYQTYGDNHSL